MADNIHHGKNVRSMRLLQGMKQQLFAAKLCVTQQYISRLENRKSIPQQTLQAIAAVLGVPAATIENFSDKTLLHPSTEGGTMPAQHTIKEVMEFFRDEIAKKDKLIAELQSKLTIYKDGNRLP